MLPAALRGERDPAPDGSERVPTRALLFSSAAIIMLLSMPFKAARTLKSPATPSCALCVCGVGEGVGSRVECRCRS